MSSRERIVNEDTESKKVAIRYACPKGSRDEMGEKKKVYPNIMAAATRRLRVREFLRCDHARLARVRVLGMFADRRALEVEEVRDCAASKGDER